MSDQSFGPPPHVDDLLGTRRSPASGLHDAQLPPLERESRRSLCLLIDISWSIERDGRTADLNRALASWPDALRADGEARRTLEVAVVVMGPNHEAVTLPLGPDGSPFSTVDTLVIPPLHPDGTTPLGAGLRTALQVCRDRAAELESTEWRRPRLVVISDGQPTDANGARDMTSWHPAARRIVNAVEHRQLRCMGVAVGDGAEEVLRQFCPQVEHLDESFEQVLQFVTMSTYYDDAETIGNGLKGFGVGR
jgi:uncharacterized protein YegL